MKQIKLKDDPEPFGTCDNSQAPDSGTVSIPENFEKF